MKSEWNILYPCDTVKGPQTGKQTGNVSSAMKNLNNSKFLSLIEPKKKLNKKT
jgi:hypothetical protein